MVPYSAIDYDIYRYKPTEREVKSDLQYYNKDSYSDVGYAHDILAYAMVTHNPDPSDHDWKFWDYSGFVQEVVSELTYSEIENYWYKDTSGSPSKCT
ncbi:MAG: hypothetical protein JW776_08415 [Candidatus Lokiarchaeota archaeon]|nr:hypothetical protein [Candidatus Lokiarchaeota archaeon]